MFYYQTNFLKKAVFLEKIVKNHLIDKNSKYLKMIGSPEVPPEECKLRRVLKLLEVKISASLTSLVWAMLLSLLESLIAAST